MTAISLMAVSHSSQVYNLCDLKHLPLFCHYQFLLPVKIKIDVTLVLQYMSENVTAVGLIYH